MTKTSARGLRRHTLPRPKGLVEGETALDLGAGLRPMPWYTPKRLHVCVEPHAPYADRLLEAGYAVAETTALDALEGYLEGGVHFDCVYLLDVIEHMDKAEGERVRNLAVQIARRQVVIFTPFGFVAQTHDAWALGGEHWQTHRSGWTPLDFSGWAIQYYQYAPSRACTKAFYALWTVR